jgi:sec-independent protein translocase protein TatA
MNVTLAVLGLSGGELVLVLVVILVLFGAKRIPEFAKGLGKGINEFKKASREVTDEIERAGEDTTPKAPAPSTASANVVAREEAAKSSNPKA